MIVYLITNAANGKRYVGQTSLSLEERWNLHVYRKTCPAMNSAIKKYGVEKFKIETLFDGLTKELADEFEKEYIERYNTRAPNGYNLTGGGDGVFNLAPEIRARLSSLMKGNKYALGAVRTEAYRKKLSDIFKGRQFSDDWRRKMSESATGRKASEQTKAKLSENRKANGQRPPKLTTEEAARAGRISGHKRYHVARGITNPQCLLCREGKQNGN